MDAVNLPEAFHIGDCAALDNPYGPLVWLEDYEDGRWLVVHFSATSERLRGGAEIVLEGRLHDIS